MSANPENKPDFYEQRRVMAVENRLKAAGVSYKINKHVPVYSSMEAISVRGTRLDSEV